MIADVGIYESNGDTFLICSVAMLRKVSSIIFDLLVVVVFVFILLLLKYVLLFNQMFCVIIVFWHGTDISKGIFFCKHMLLEIISLVEV